MNDYRLGFELGLLSLTESEEKLDIKSLESEEPFDLLLNVLGTKRETQRNGWRIKRVNKGIGIYTKDKKFIVIIQNSGKKWLYTVKMKGQDRNIKTFQGITLDKLRNAINQLLNNGQNR